MKSGIELIAEERKRQVEKEGWSAEHDSDHWRGELADAAACYTLGKSAMEKYFNDGIGGEIKLTINLWPWEKKWWKPTRKDRIKELTKAGALIAAEIDRIQNQQNKP